jgi:hypothetical protein
MAGRGDLDLIVWQTAAKERIRWLSAQLAIRSLSPTEATEPLVERELILRGALERIERWFGEFPQTGQTWNDGSEMSYAACFGSNGERDFMRDIARAALSSSISNAEASDTVQHGFCNKCGYNGPISDDIFPGQHKRPRDGEYCNYSAIALPTATEDSGEVVQADRERIARVHAEHGATNPWWWDEVFNDGLDETAADLREQDLNAADALIAALRDHRLAARQSPDSLVEAARAVVKAYPIAAGIVLDEDGRDGEGPIRALRLELASLPNSPSDGEGV